MDIYSPAEDSFLLKEFVEKEVLKKKPLSVLDMGSGSGIQAEAALSAGVLPESIVLVDKNPLAVDYLKEKFPKSKVVLSDLFEKLDTLEKFDLMIFNPPYLPEDRLDSGIDTSGGEKGSEVINDFLGQAALYLNKNGRILLLTSSLTKGIKWKKYYRKLLGKKKIFFEELYVWELVPLNT